MAEPILKLTRGVPKTDREWMDVFRNITKFFRVSGDELVIGGGIALPPQSVGTAELEPKAVTNDKLRDSAALSLVGRPAGSGGAPSDIIATVPDTFMVRRGSALTWDVLEDGDVPGSIARGADVTDAVSAHESAPDPHPQYLTEPEGDARYLQLGNVPAVLSLLLSGAGDPEGAVVAGVGSLFLRTDGSAGSTLYVKESGSGNTGWVAK